jgi:hypothetical protein
MSQSNISQEIDNLRPGFTMDYLGKKWNVQSYNTYEDARGYETAEWLLKPLDNNIDDTEYYLLREFDPDNFVPQGSLIQDASSTNLNRDKFNIDNENYGLNDIQNTNINFDDQDSDFNWYFSQEIKNPKILLASTEENIFHRLWEDIYQNKQQKPYSEILLENKSYYFKSQTDGIYQDGGRDYSRITWDYWDKEYQENLVIEAWENKKVHVYLSKAVNIEEFSNIQNNLSYNNSSENNLIESNGKQLFSYVLQIILASACLLFGIILLLI